MYLSNDDNSSTVVKNPLHKELDTIGLTTKMNYDPTNKFQSSEESTLDSSISSSLPEVGEETKPCHWVNDTPEVVVRDFSIEMDVDEVSVLNSSMDSFEFSVQTPLSPDQIDSSCCEPGAIEVTVAWDSFQNMVTYVTPSFPEISTTTKQRRRRSSRRKSRGKLVPLAVSNHHMNWDVDFPLRRLAETSTPGRRSADI